MQTIKEYFKEKGITQTEAAKRLGVSSMAVNQLVNGTAKFGKKTASAWADAFGFNPLWLMTGEGEMLLHDITADASVRKVPVVNFDTIGGYRANEVVDMEECVVAEMPLSAELAHDGDFIMQVSGDSMSPKFPAGCYVLLREVEMWREYLELGLCYMLLLRDGRRVIKDVRAGSDREHFLLCSVNPQFDPVEVSLDFVVRVYMVVVLIRKEIN